MVQQVNREPSLKTVIWTSAKILAVGVGGYFGIRSLIDHNGAVQSDQLKLQATLNAPGFLPTATPTFPPTSELPMATATLNPTETPTPEPDLFASFSAQDRKILAEVGNLDKQQKWQDVLTSVNANYAGWTGIAQIGTDGKYHGLYADGNFHEMPANYTPENNPITQAAWPDRVFPPGYFNGVQPLNAPDMVDGRPTVMTRIYQEDRNNIPTDVVAAKGSQVLIGQGLRVELDNGSQFFDEQPAFVISFDANLHGHLTKGEWDLLWLPQGLTESAQQLVGFTWLNGVRASTAEWQPKVHGADYNHANTFEVSGNAFNELTTTPLWLNGEQSNILNEIGSQMSVSKVDPVNDKSRFTVTKNLNPLDYVNGNPFSDPFSKAAIAIPAVTVPIFSRRRRSKTK